MGSTCFMNTILQTFLHNPFLKAHFLSDKHSSRKCQKEASTCMACQLDKLFSQFYATDTTPFTPHAFLYAMWMSQKHLAGYSQQDAHEFFISILDEIHNNCSGTLDSSNCKCVVHKVFGGILQSDVTCLQCNNVTFSYDPILDLSLEIKSSAKQTKKKKPDGDEAEYTLSEFTVPEKLGSNQYHCKSCGSFEEAIKQLSMKTLPPVLSIQFKRFEHSLATSNKIDTKVKIPSQLDMTPHTTRAVKMRSMMNKSKSSRTPNKQNYDSVSDGVPSYQYNLFAVVCHEGKLDTGHYKAFCKINDIWFEFDDHNVSIVDHAQFSSYVPNEYGDPIPIQVKTEDVVME
ncbi:hypothetical protein HK103_006045 [Boothiomyces macroporosus]|uniref:USP domain-containing protein n=1 Tax=Boothiomyces macroporosus TaxID=261099 RepID=A0AAD5UI92_9FUNG|nr:hypothetical protein HK103_006045 [Boothiomyces macroporosus]